jgi:tripartite ATP-independent transporter DctP family solute receptor
MKTGKILLTVTFFVIVFGLSSGIITNIASAEKTKISLAHLAPPGFVYQTIAEKFKQIIEEKVGDKVTVVIYPSGQLGEEKDTLEGEILGTVDMSIVNIALLSLWEPRMTYLDIPYLFRSAEHAMNVINGPVGQSIHKNMEKHGIMVLSCLGMGFNGIGLRKGPIFTPDQLAGMKIRVIQNPLHVDLVNSWGAKAVPMNFGEVYTALQQGVLDGVVNSPWGGYHIMKHYEVAPYFCLTDQYYWVSALTMSKKKFDSLPNDVQQAFLDSREVIVSFAAEKVEELTHKTIGSLVMKGIIYNVPNLDAFRKASKSVTDKYAEKIGIDIIEQIRAVK